MGEIETIVDWCKKQTTVPLSDLSDTLLKALKHSSRGVGEVFFNNSASPEYSTWNGQDFSHDIDELAVMYAAYAVKRVAVRNFSACIIDESTVKNMYEQFLACSAMPKGLLTNWINQQLGANQDLPHLKADDKFRSGFLEKMHDITFIKMNVFDQLFQNNLCPQYLALITEAICSTSEYQSVIQAWSDAMKSEEVEAQLAKNSTSKIDALAKILRFTVSPGKFLGAIESATQSALDMSKKLKVAQKLVGYITERSLKDVGLLPPLGEGYHIGSDLGNTEIAVGLNSFLGSNGDFTQAAINAANIYKDWTESSHVIVYSETYYQLWGEKLASWLTSDQGPKALHLTTSAQPNNMQSTFRGSQTGTLWPYFPPVNVGGCFIHGTKILLDDFSSMPIEDLTVGQRIITRLDENTHLKSTTSSSPNIQYGVVSTERPGFVCEQGTTIFGFNDEMPFFTAEHVFYTITGLRAVNPAAAMKENQFLDVGYLRPGDVVFRARKRETYEYEYVRIKSFTHSVIPKGTPVFGVHLREGLRSYHANNYLVWLNYPEITVDRAIQNINKIPRLSEKVQTIKHVKKMLPLLNRVLGPFTEKAVHAALTNDDHPLQHAAKSKYGNGHYTAITAENGSVTTQNDMVVGDHELHLNNDDFKHHKNALKFGHRWTPMRHVTTTFNIEARHGINELYHHKKSESRQLASKLLPQSISLVSGTLLIDGKYVKNVTIDENSIRWTRKITDGNVTASSSLASYVDHAAEYEHGSIHFTPERFSGWGSVIHTVDSEPTDDYAHPQNRLHFTATSSTNVYGSKVSTNKTFPDANENNLPIIDNSITWSDTLPYSVELGVVDGNPVAQLKLASDDEKIDAHLTVGHNDKHFLTLTIDVDPTVAFMLSDILPADQVFISFYCVFSWDYAALNGYAVRFDKNNSAGYRGEICAWAGATTTDLKALVLNASQAVITHLAEDVHLSSSRQSPSATNDYIRSISSLPSSISSGASKITRLLSNTLTDLSVMDLVTMSGPDDGVLHETTQALLKQATVYHVPDDWRTNFFGQTKPKTLDKRLVAIDEKEKDYLTQKFGVAWLCEGMSTESELAKKLPPDAKDKLRYFWKGRQEGSLASSKEYSKLNEKAAAIAFEQLVPTLQRYIQSGKANVWAKALFDKLMNEVVLNGLAIDVVFNGKTVVNKHCMVLYCLAPTENYSSQLWQAVMMQKVATTSTLYRGGNETQEFLTDTYKILIEKILNDDPSINAEVKDALGKDIKEHVKELQLSAELSAAQAATELVDKMGDLSAALLKYYQSTDIPSPVWKKLESLKKWITDTKPGKLVGLVYKLFSFSAFVLATLSTLQELVKWNDLTPAQKAQSVVNAIYIVAKIIASAPEAWASLVSGARTLKDAGAWLKAQCRFTRAQLIPPEEIEMVNMNQAAIAEEAATDAIQVESKWSKFFAMAERACKFLNLCVLVASAVVIGFQIKADFDDDAPAALKAMDIMQLICITIGFVVEVAFLVTGLAILPVIGICVAIAGIVFAFVSLFIHKDPPKPPESPAEKWIRETGTPFVDKCKIGEQKLDYIFSPASPVTTNLKTDMKLTMKNRTTNPVYLKMVKVQITCGLTTPDQLLTVDEKSIPSPTVNLEKLSANTNYASNILLVCLNPTDVDLFSVSTTETIIVTIPNIQFNSHSGTCQLEIEEYCADSSKRFDTIDITKDFTKQ